MGSLNLKSKKWSKQIPTGSDILQRKYWENILILAIALIFIAMAVSSSLDMTSKQKMLGLIGMAIFAGMLLTIGKQCAKKTDNPQLSLTKLIASTLNYYARLVVITYIIAYVLYYIFM